MPAPARRDHVPDRLAFFRNGWLLDEVWFENTIFSLKRTTQARFVIHLAGSWGALTLDLWTAPRWKLDARSFDGPAPDWLEATFDGDQCDEVRGAAVSVHFENMDRNGYFLGLSQREEHWSLSLGGAGYLKLAPARPTNRHRQRLELEGALAPAELRGPLALALRVDATRLVFACPQESTNAPAMHGRVVVTVESADDSPMVITVKTSEQSIAVATRLARALRRRVQATDEHEGTKTIVTAEGDILRAT